ncbi:MAG: hypothetical protein ACYDHD_02060 [Vulcanimicrobiaceae bacterium]
MTQPSVSARPTGVVGPAVAAGILAGILIDAFIISIKMAPFPGVYQFIASGLVGKVAFSSSAYIWLGLLLHFVISVVWALLYVFIARALGVLRSWIWSGIVFGIVVLIGMQIVVVARGLAPLPELAGLGELLIAHVIFFGLPIAFYLRRLG